MAGVRKELKNLKVYTPGKPIEEVKRALGLVEVAKLASNELPFPPRYIRQAILQELAHINRYPEGGCFYLRKALAKKLSVKEDQLVFGNGSDELITLVLRSFIGRGDEVVVAYPTFLIYEMQATIQGAKIKKVPLCNFRYDLKAMAKAVTKRTKVVFIANPDNPTGSYANDRMVKDFLKVIPKDVIVFFDEAYFEFAPYDFPRSEKFLKRRGNIIYTRTFSKAYGLAGLRVGYGVTTSEIAAVLNKVRDPFNVNRFAQVAALAALDNKKFVTKAVAAVKKEKKYLYKEMKTLGLTTLESATNFILVDFKKNTSGLYDYLLQKGVIIRQMQGWGLRTFFRVNAGTHKENVTFVKALKEYRNSIKRRPKR